MLSISSIFRPHQHFFSWYGGYFRKALQTIQHFFVQNAESKQLLAKIGIDRCTISGDTRFDRVYEIAQSTAEVDIARRFKGNEKLMVIGSSWADDLEVLAPFIHEQKDNLRFILAPHELSEEGLQQAEQQISARHIRYSKVDDATKLSAFQVLIIDNIGMLSRLYRYGEFAYVGGGFGDGLHNILEAACYGIPVFFGNQNYDKFQEAHDLLFRGGAFAIDNYHELREKYNTVSQPENYLLACDVCKGYVEENRGATNKIVKYCNNILSNS